MGFAQHVPPPRAEAALAYLELASERGEYAWFGSMFVAAGRVPAA